ncbi:hypothetical protein EG329_013547 [Mollisiaceae sp. DMI_Dod_QoI]|nr:hypothetical protein EG329_013547 [Helotiales sp. DMI_Dod_QoI]
MVEVQQRFPKRRRLQRARNGHYSYECKAVARPYVSRPSRTQQLFDPKLAPKLTSDIPQDLLRKKGVADEQLAKADRGRKRERQSEGPETRTKRMRSASSASVSTISTNLSRSPSPQPSREPDRRKFRSMSISESPHQRLKSPSLSPRSYRQKLSDPEKKRRRESVSSVDSYDEAEKRMSGERESNRSTRRRFQQASPPARGRRTTESRSPPRERRKLSNDRQRGRGSFGDGGSNLRKNNKPSPKERSLSPFSKRLALTQAMNMDR